MVVAVQRHDYSTLVQLSFFLFLIEGININAEKAAGIL